MIVLTSRLLEVGYIMKLFRDMELSRWGFETFLLKLSLLYNIMGFSRDAGFSGNFPDILYYIENIYLSIYLSIYLTINRFCTMLGSYEYFNYLFKETLAINITSNLPQSLKILITFIYKEPWVSQLVIYLKVAD